MPNVEVYAPSDLDPADLAAQLSAALGQDITVTVVGESDVPQLNPPPADVDHATAVAVVRNFRTSEMRQLDQLVEKARRVWQGTDTFTNAQAQKIIAGLVLIVARRLR